MTKKAAYEFIERYFAIPDDGGEFERKAYKRFKASTATEGLSEDVMRALFKAATGETATYLPYPHVSPIVYQQYQKDARAIVDAMDGKPTSLSDLALKAKLVNIWKIRKSYDNDAVRRCFHAMGKEGIISMVEVSTCGRCAIRLYSRL